MGCVQVNIKACLAECFGMFFYVLLFTSFQQELSWASPVATGLFVFAMASAVGDISGCQLNPAITLTMMMSKNLDIASGLMYIFAQVVGGMSGAGLRIILRGDDSFGGHLRVAINTPAPTSARRLLQHSAGFSHFVAEPSGNFWIEFFGAVLLLFILLNVGLRAKSKCGPACNQCSRDNAAYAFAVTAGHVGVVMLGGASSLNPARAICTAIFESMGMDGQGVMGHNVQTPGFNNLPSRDRLLARGQLGRRLLATSSPTMAPTDDGWWQEENGGSLFWIWWLAPMAAAPIALGLYYLFRGDLQDGGRQTCPREEHDLPVGFVSKRHATPKAEPKPKQVKAEPKKEEPKKEKKEEEPKRSSKKEEPKIAAAKKYDHLSDEEKLKSVKIMDEMNPLIGIRFEEYPGDGVAVLKVPEELPAYKCGVRQGDVITTVDEEIVDDKKEFMQLMHNAKPGDRFQLVIDRPKNGKKEDPNKTKVNIELVVGTKGMSIEDVKKHREIADEHEPAWQDRAKTINAFDGNMQD